MIVKKIFDLIFEPIEEEEKQEEVIVDKPLIRHRFAEEPTKTEMSEEERKRAEVKKKDVLDKTFIDADRINKRSGDNYKRDLKPITKYESQPALSPIYGNLDQADSSDNTYVPKRAYKKSSLGTVLSPIYGIVDKNETSEEKEIIEKTNKESVVFAQSNIKPLEENFDDIKPIEMPSEVRAELRNNSQLQSAVSFTPKTPISSILGSPFEDDLREDTHRDITLFDDFEHWCFFLLELKAVACLP